MLAKIIKEQILELRKAVLEIYVLQARLWGEDKKENSKLVYSQYEEMAKELLGLEEAFKEQEVPSSSELIKVPCRYVGFYTDFNKDEMLDLAVTGNPEGKGKMVIENQETTGVDVLGYRIFGCPIGTKIYSWWAWELEWKLLAEVDSNYVTSDSGVREELERKPSLLFAKNFGNKEQFANCEELEKEEKTLLVEKTGQRAFRFITGF